MPYARAHWLMLLFLAATMLAFWPGYFSVLDEVPWQFHLHGLTATAWMLLLAFQSWAIAGRRNLLHRQAGLSMLLLIPLFTAGGLAVVQTMVAGTGPFAAVQGTRLALVDGLSSFAFAGFAFAALANRRNPHLHGGWLLATAVMLVMPVATRLLPDQWIDGLRPELTGIERFTVGFDISSAIALSIALLLAWLHPKGRRPFLAVALVTLMQWAGFHLTDHVPGWQGFTAIIAGAPVLMLPLMGALLGAAAVWLGWQAGAPSRRKAPAR
jgi:hypothetical protein